MTSKLNFFHRTIWILLNIFFGGFMSLVMLIWVGCDMNMPTFFFPLLPSSSVRSVFRVPWIDLKFPLLVKVVFNVSLFAHFGFVHTFFAQDMVQRYILIKLSLPKTTMRTFYLVLTNIAAWLLMGLWQHTSIQLWDILSHFSMEGEYKRHRILLSLFTIITLPGKND
jgi:hypothetical protein